jgi:hypothetical protein
MVSPACKNYYVIQIRAIHQRRPDVRIVDISDEFASGIGS